MPYPVCLGGSQLKSKLFTVLVWHPPLFVTVNFVFSFLAVVNAHLKEIEDAWNHHFGG